MNYSVILDEKVSSIVPTEGKGMSFKEAVNEILEYVRDAGYDLQEAIFENILKEGEQSFLDGKNTVVLA